MRLRDYLVRNKLKPTPWADQHKIGSVIILRYLNGIRGLSVQTMAKIVEATNGQVTYQDLIAEMRERQADRQNQTGNNQSGH